MSEANLAELHNEMTQYFNTGELRGLCFDLNIPYEDLAAQTLAGVARELVAYCRRRGCTDELLSYLRKARPHVKWSFLPQAFPDSDVSTSSVSAHTETRLALTVETDFDGDSARLQALWRLAYAFLCLDQLPSGGWSKTLSSWMETIWEGDNGQIPRNPGMRRTGGTDLTCYAFYNYYIFLKNTLPSTIHVTRFMFNNSLVERVQKNLANKIGWDGGIGTSQWPRATMPGIPLGLRVRHTLLGIITFLLFGEARQFAEQVGINRTHKYLVDSMQHWEHDKTYPFGMFAAAVKLNDLLSRDIARRQLAPDQIESMQTLLATHMPAMISGLKKPFSYKPRPEGQIEGSLSGPYFRPYYDFWRLERSGFLMYFPFLLTDDGSAFLRDVDDGLQMKCVQIFLRLLEEISHPYDEENPYNHLVSYHRNPTRKNVVSLDWGLSAELAVLLGMPAVRHLLVNNRFVDAEQYHRTAEALNAALLQTFDRYHVDPAIFRFTHGASFSRILHLFSRTSIRPSELEKLDRAINALCSEGVTERGLMEFIQNHVCRDVGGNTEVNLRSLKDLLLFKLESGEHTPDGVICKQEHWKLRIQDVVHGSTINFYDSELGDQYAARYGPNPKQAFISALTHNYDWASSEQKIALDVGCGPGQYAQLFKDLGFEVKLLDASKKMLELACDRLGIPQDTFEPTNIFDRSWGFSNAHFDLIFACAMMVHVPIEQANQIYKTFHRLLKPKGVLFVNYKIGDHSLISEDGRFFEYYRDELFPQKRLEEAGFRIEDTIITHNYENMYYDPKRIKWVNFFCRKWES